MLALADPARAKGRDLTVRDVLDEASATVEAKLADQPEVQSQVRAMIAGTYIGLGFGEPAIPHLEYALASYRRQFVAEHSETLSVFRQLGEVVDLPSHFALAAFHKKSMSMTCPSVLIIGVT